MSFPSNGWFSLSWYLPFTSIQLASWVLSFFRAATDLNTWCSSIHKCHIHCREEAGCKWVLNCGCQRWQPCGYCIPLPCSSGLSWRRMRSCGFSGARPRSHLTYTMAQTKANYSSGKTQSPNALLYPEILLCFKLSAVHSHQSAELLLPVHKQDWWGKERKEGKKVPFGNYSLWVNSCLTAEPAPQTPTHVHLRLCAAIQCQYCLFVLLLKSCPQV